VVNPVVGPITRPVPSQWVAPRWPGWLLIRAGRFESFPPDDKIAVQSRYLAAFSEIVLVTLLEWKDLQSLHRLYSQLQYRLHLLRELRFYRSLSDKEPLTYISS